MAQSSTPHFKNDTGHHEIRIGVRTFQCIGASPPHDHPHIYLNLGDDQSVVCPYCSTLYRLDLSLAPGAADPVDAVCS